MCMAWLQAKSQAKPGHTGQAKPSQKCWPGLDFLKAKANGPGHGFEHYFCKQLPPIIITLTVAWQALELKSLTYLIEVDRCWTDLA